MKQTINFGAGDVTVDVTLDTLVIYEQEFQGADMIHDMYKPIDIHADDKPEDVIATIDLTAVNWTKLIRVLWAAEKTADATIPRFAQWVKTQGEVNLLELNAQLVPIVEDGLFRQGGTASD